jgi:hypothetical protein
MGFGIRRRGVIVVDSSAVIAILFGEPAAPSLLVRERQRAGKCPDSGLLSRVDFVDRSLCAGSDDQFSNSVGIINK